MSKREYKHEPLVRGMRSSGGAVFHTITREGSTHLYVTYITGAAQRARSGKWLTHPGPAQEKLHRWPASAWSDRHYFGWVFRNEGKFPELDAMIAALKPKQLKVCRLRYGQGMTTQEVAKHLRITQRAVQRILVRAKNTMREKQVELSL